MGEVKLTEYQKAAVENQGGTLLISAAAGSGKTHVLIDRMLRRVTAETDPCNIDDFLMITFTKAAATELRGKIIRRLNELLAEDGNSKHLRQQLSRVYLAQISTIHGFCSSLLRDYAHDLDLPADFRIMEESEGEIYRNKVMTKLLNQSYSEKDPDIMATMDVLGFGRDDRTLPQMILRTYEAVCNSPDRDNTMQTLRDMLMFHYDESVSNSPWGRYLIDEFHYYISQALEQVEQAFETIREYPWLDKYISAFEELRDMLVAYSRADTWDGIYQIVPVFSPAGRVMKCPDKRIKESVKEETLDKIKERLKKWREKFALPSEEIVEDLCETAPALRGLLTLTVRFMEGYTKEKQSRHLLDYNDLEQETLRLLYGKGSTPTAAAKEISQRYVELMIDEYQDTNGVQDKIFSAISRNGENLFFVGDVKQSIYRFRRAEPKIFTTKYYSYADYAKAKDGQPRRILLSDNFRSSKAILAAANDVFRLHMNQRVGDVDYGEEEALRAKGKITELSYPAVELHCINIDKENEDPEKTKHHYEAEFVARRISGILQNETLPEGQQEVKTRPEDIVILLRALSEKAPIYQKALQRYGIRSVCSNDNLFEAEEISFLYCLLQVIDNPHRDIPLLSVLLSKPVRYSPDTLAFARAADKDRDIYEAICAYDPEAPFLSVLSKLRTCAQQGSIRELFDLIEEHLLLRKIYSRTQYNLDAFAALVDQFDNGTRYGLSAFLGHLDRIKEKGVHGDDIKAKGAVQITTIHKSKGLEYPIVFLCGIGSGFNKRDSYQNMQIDDEFGVATKVVNKELRATYPTVALQAINHKIQRESLSEEMRILYVAMTRPKHRLIMTYCDKGVDSHIAKLAKKVAVPMPSLVTESATSLGDWVLMTALTHSESGALYSEEIPCRDYSPYPWRMECHEGADYTPCEDAEEEISYLDDDVSLQEVKYAYIAHTRQESKVTATQLKGGEKAEGEKKESFAPIPRYLKPNFTEKKLSPTERGTAIHMAMQYIRYELCTDLPAIDGELDRLVSQGFIIKEQRAVVPPEKIYRFFQSSLGKRVLSAQKVIREFKFSILEEAGKYDPALSGEKLLLQGVTDCCIVEDGALTILDFKSDNITVGQQATRGEYYRGQINAYADALSRIFGLPIKDKILYFFATDSAYVLADPEM